MAITVNPYIKEVEGHPHLCIAVPSGEEWVLVTSDIDICQDVEGKISAIATFPAVEIRGSIDIDGLVT